VQTDPNGLLYMRARYYNPLIRRFINQDVQFGDLNPGISLNRFAFANGNPVSLMDPLGLCAESDDPGTSAMNLLGAWWEGIESGVGALQLAILSFESPETPLASKILYDALEGGATSAVEEAVAAEETALFSPSDLSGIERASQPLIDAVGSRRTITWATEGTDALRYLNYKNAEAAAFPASGDIIVRPNPSKAALLEEFLHGTQSRLGIIDRLGRGASETHVKEFMIRHKNMLGLSPEDVTILQTLKDMGL